MFKFHPSWVFFSSHCLFGRMLDSRTLDRERQLPRGVVIPPFQASIQDTYRILKNYFCVSLLFDICMSLVSYLLYPPQSDVRIHVVP